MVKRYGYGCVSGNGSSGAGVCRLDFCEECLAKQQKIDRLEDENKSLKAKLNYRNKKTKSEFFGNSTPSSKRYVKTNSKKENQAKQGGAKTGHKGNAGRHTFSESEADEVIELKVCDEDCPKCGGRLEIKETNERCVLDTLLLEAKRLLYKCQVKRCRSCRTEVSQEPLVLPRGKFGTKLLSNSVCMYYLQRIPLKRIEDMWGKDMVAGNLIKQFHKLAKMWEPSVEKLEEAYRNAAVKHADETGWRTNGHSGYAWLFCTREMNLFQFGKTRSSQVVGDILGTDPLPGVLIVDRYPGYNKAPCKIQYCFEHLKRDLDKLGDKNPGSLEVTRFIAELRPLLVKAMKLRNKVSSNDVFEIEAAELKEKILALIRAPAKHFGIQTYQDIFKDNKNRLFHWADSRAVIAENNTAERELRPSIIARKVSFGSQSQKGADTRSTLMSILHTAVKRLDDQAVHHWFCESLEKLILNPHLDPFSLLPPTSNS